MKKLLFACCLVLISSVSFAASTKTITLKTDPQAGVYSYKITGIGSTDIIINAQADGSLQYDISTIAAGTYNLSVVPLNMWDDPAPTPATVSFRRSIPIKASGLGLVVTIK